MEFLKKTLKKTKQWPKRSIIWYCGNSQEPWSPLSLEKGVAGAQTAVIYLSREWAKSGHNVQVYNNCGSEEGIYDGVKYINFNKLNKDEEFDILIIWREMNLNILEQPIKAKKLFSFKHSSNNFLLYVKLINFD